MGDEFSVIDQISFLQDRRGDFDYKFLGPKNHKMA